MSGGRDAVTEASPLIVTLALEAAAAARFTALRHAHFPAGRNWLAAHLTLFHALPGASVDTVAGDLEALAGATAPFAMQVDRLLFLGGGVAYGIASPEGRALRRSLADRWDAMLGRQDRAWQGRLHITVQNKVDPAVARALHARLADAFVPETIGAVGLELWHYLGGPWGPAGAFTFRG